MALGFPAAWVKSPTLTAGQCPVMHYNRDLMMAVLWDRMPYLTPLLNTEVIPLEQAVEAYQIFHDGSPKKFVIDPHNMTKLISTEKAGARAEGQYLSTQSVAGSQRERRRRNVQLRRPRCHLPATGS